MQDRYTVYQRDERGKEWVWGGVENLDSRDSGRLIVPYSIMYVCCVSVTRQWRIHRGWGRLPS